MVGSRGFPARVSLHVVPARRSLTEVLLDAQRLGTLGDRPIEEVIAHARRFLVPLEQVVGRVLDLGTGAGVPGLVIAEARADFHLTLLDRRGTRMDTLRVAVSALGLEDRVEVVTGEAETIARESGRARTYAAVVARGFGPPLETARVARPFLGSHGVLIVSEPPEWDPGRWPEDALRALGFGPAARLDGVAQISVLAGNP